MPPSITTFEFSIQSFRRIGSTHVNYKNVAIDLCAAFHLENLMIPRNGACTIHGSPRSLKKITLKEDQNQFQSSNKNKNAEPIASVFTEPYFDEICFKYCIDNMYLARLISEPSFSSVKRMALSLYSYSDSNDWTVAKNLEKTFPNLVDLCISILIVSNNLLDLSLCIPLGVTKVKIDLRFFDYITLRGPIPPSVKEMIICDRIAIDNNYKGLSEDRICYVDRTLEESVKSFARFQMYGFTPSMVVRNYTFIGNSSANGDNDKNINV